MSRNTECTNGKHLLILGAGVMQIPAIDIAKELGLLVTVADGNRRAEGIKKADRFLHIDLKDKEALAKAALKSDIPIDGVFTAGTDFSASVAWVAEKLKTPGIPFKVAQRATDKALMREAFSSSRVPSPAFVYFDSAQINKNAIELIDKLIENLTYPLVVKPVDNMGARGIRRVDSIEECRKAVLEAVPLSKKGRVIVEEYIEGNEYSVDALVWDDQIYICGIADRHIHFAPYFIEMGHTMPTKASEKVQNEIINVFKQGIKALGITQGAAKGDIKYNAKGAFVGEIAARLSGGYMSGWTYPYASGILPTVGGIKVALGLPPFSDFCPQQNVSAEHAYISIPGKVRNISGVQKGITVPYIKNHFSRVSVGDRLRFPRNNVEKCGNFISQAPNRSKAVDSVKAACSNIRIELEADDKETLSFLTSPGNKSYFKCTKNSLEKIGLMPLWYGQLEKEENPGSIKKIIPCPWLRRERMQGWYGDSIQDAIDSLKPYGIIETGSGFSIGAPAWFAIIAGGVQGGIWFFDTLQMHIKNGTWQEWLENWC